MVDHQFSDVTLATMYDAFCPWETNGDYYYYLELVMSADAVLDVGCGTGALLTRARETGHTGCLTGLDPGAGMLEVARRKRSDIEWIAGDLTTNAWDRQFDLVVMTGHAFQVFTGDDELRTSLDAIRKALKDDGRLAFETRNPLDRAWERWTQENGTEIINGSGDVVRMWGSVDKVEGELVTFTLTYESPTWDHVETSASTLRFLDAQRLSEFLGEAGLAIDEQFGTWDRGPLTSSSPEIITVARR